MKLKIMPSYLTAVIGISKSTLGESILRSEIHIDIYKSVRYDLSKNDLSYDVNFLMPDTENNFIDFLMPNTKSMVVETIYWPPSESD